MNADKTKGAYPRSSVFIGGPNVLERQRLYLFVQIAL